MKTCKLFKVSSFISAVLSVLSFALIVVYNFAIAGQQSCAALKRIDDIAYPLFVAGIAVLCTSLLSLAIAAKKSE